VIGQVKDYNGTVFAHHVAVDDLLAPGPQLLRVGRAPFESDIRISRFARQLAYGRVVAAFTRFDDFGGRSQTRAFGEAGLGNAFQLDQKVEIAKGIDSGSGLWHGCSPEKTNLEKSEIQLVYSNFEIRNTDFWALTLHSRYCRRPTWRCGR